MPPQNRGGLSHGTSCHNRTQETVQTLTHGSLPQVGAKATAGLLQLIQAERNGDTVNRQLLAHLLRMLSSLGTYQTAFQVPLLYIAARCSWKTQLSFSPAGRPWLQMRRCHLPVAPGTRGTEYLRRDRL